MSSLWWARIAAKILLSRVPLSYRAFARLGAFRHGRMHDPGYATGVFNRHFHRASRAADAAGAPLKPGFVALEFGVGDSVASALLAQARGASRCYLIDAGRYAIEDTAIYRRLAEAMQVKGEAVAPAPATDSFSELLAHYQSEYLTDGLRSLQQIPDASVDLVWSNAVLEHIRRSEFVAVQREFRRLMKPGGIASHRIDLKDHLGGALNNRRLASSLWEQDWFADSGFYTNRIGYREMLALFAQAGFEPQILQVDRWPTLPTPIARMAPEFRDLDEDELLVSGFDVLLRPAQARGASASRL